MLDHSENLRYKRAGGISMRKYIVLFLVISLLGGCRGKDDSGSAPGSEEVKASGMKVGQIDCPLADISLSAEAIAIPANSSEESDILYNVEVDISAACADKAIEGAPVIVEFWWRQKATGYTDANGDLKLTMPTSSSGESGAWVYVTLTDNTGNALATQTLMVQARF
jgi:hypothetical protein